MYIDKQALNDLEERYRVALVNSLSGFKSANLVGTAGADGQTNLAIVSSVFHLGADPALMGFISRPPSVDRHTLENIEALGEYTLNHVHADIVEAAHQTSARYPREQSEFDAVGLTPMPAQTLAAPYVAESRVRLGMRLCEMKPVEVNNTVMVIGEIVEIHVPDSAVGDDGFIDLEGLGTVAVSGLDSYHRTEKVSRLSYAKPGRPPREVS